MSEGPPVKQWLCCNCGGNNSYVRDPSCAICSNHLRGPCCAVREDGKLESQLFNTIDSQPQITATPSTLSSSSRSVPDHRPTITQQSSHSDQKSPTTTGSSIIAPSAIDRDGKPPARVIAQPRDGGDEDCMPGMPGLGKSSSDAPEPSRKASTHSYVQAKADQLPAAMSPVYMDESKSQKSGAKRDGTVTQDLRKSQARVSICVDEDNEDDFLSREHSHDKREESTDHSAAQRESYDQAHDQRTAQRVSRSRSVSSSSSDSCPSNRTTVTSNGNNEIRLRIDANAPLSLQFNGDMEGRNMQLIPTEDGMAELVISGNNYGASAPPRHRRPTMDSRSQKQREALEYINRQRLKDVPLDDRIHRAAKRASRVSITPGPDDKEETESDMDKQSSKTPVDSSRPQFVPSGSARDDPLSNKRPLRPRRSSFDYHVEPRPPPRPNDQSGAAVIQPATTQRKRRPSVTAGRMSYSGRPEPQYPWTSVGAGDRSKLSTTHRWPMRYIVDSSCVDTELSNVPRKSMNSIRRGPLPAVIIEQSLEDASVVSKTTSPRVLAAPSAVLVDSINKSTPHTTTKQQLHSSDDESPASSSGSAALRISDRLDSTSESPHRISDSQTEPANDPNLDVFAKDLGNDLAIPESIPELVKEPHTFGEPPLGLPTPSNPDFQVNPVEEAMSAFESCTKVDASGDIATDAEMADDAGLDNPSTTSIHNHGAIDTWLDGGVADDNGVNFEWEYGDSPSGPSSYAASIASVFSVASLASSASDMSRGSGYSAVQIATATKVLLAIFYEDGTLLSLYKSAIESQAIGPARLQRNLRRLFRAYAGLLEGEATERLEYLASRLVLIKSAMLAQFIVEKLQNGRAALPLSRKERNEESSDEEEDSVDVRPVNEDAFEDLAIFREFLVESEAFKTFRVQLQAFIVPKSTHLMHLESARSGDIANAATTEAIAEQEITSTWQNWRNDSEKSTGGFFWGAYGKETANSVLLRMTDAFMSATDDVMIAAGLLEPPLGLDTVRLRWQCACGESLHSDVAELRRGGIDELVDHMRRTSGAKVRVSAHSHQSGNQQYIAPHPIQWIRKAVTSIFGGSTRRSSSCLPQHNTPCTATSTTNNPQPQQSILHLLACMHRNRLRKVLQQERIEDVTTDRALLCFLRKQYLRHRGRFLYILSLKSVKGISFVKFRLPIGGSVDVRHHDPCCVTNNTGQVSCECIPPPPKVEPSPGAEYRCIPGPPATYPPIPPVYLASLFTCPTDVHEKDTWILDQLPKRTCGELRGQVGQPAEGWGIYYDEGLDRDTLALTVLVVFLVASLLFGVLWSRFQYDVQGAFGVSAYMVACCAVLLPVIVTRLENKG